MVASKTKRRWVFGKERNWNLWRAALPPVNNSDILECNYSSFSDNLLLASHELFKLLQALLFLSIQRFGGLLNVPS